MRTLFVALVFSIWVAPSALAQVRVEVRPSKDVYLQGEPIYVEMTVTNVGEYPIAYGAVGVGHIQLRVGDRLPYEWRRHECGFSALPPVPPVAMSSHPPTFKPGQTISFRYQLRGYRLEPGRHDIGVTGSAPVSWYQEQAMATQPPQPPPVKIPFRRGAPVEGANVNRTISIELAASDRPALLRALDPLIERARYAPRYDLDAVGFLESAAPFVPDLIFDLASLSHLRGVYAYQALADINTPASRAQLRRFFDEADSLDERAMILNALKRTSNADSVDFFASLLPGRSTPADQRIKDTALSALQCLGGDEVNRRIVAGVRGWDRETALRGLANTGVREAVTDIVDYPLGDSVDLMMKSCGALSRLTHHFCDMDRWLDLLEDDPELSRQVVRREQAIWRLWWAANQGRLPIHGPDDEWNGPGEMPLIK